ncbi:MAG TPA: hypothetical protein VKS60_14875, partial [Stellaceae bacterium]|nr:hypothetical protein [Stellaceae bacterium]
PTLSPPKGRRGRSAAALLLALLQLAPAAHADTLGAFTSWESGIDPMAPQEAPQWLDEQTLVFRGDLGGKPDSSSAAVQRKQRIISWTLGQAPTAIDDDRWVESRRAFLCAADGEIAYSIGGNKPDPKSGRTRIAIGPPGKMQDRQVRIDDRGAIPAERGMLPVGRVVGLVPSCVPRAEPRMAEHLWAADGTGRYAVDFAEIEHQAERNPVVLRPLVPGVPTLTVDLTDRDVDPACTIYATFTGLFYLRQCGGLRAVADPDESCPGYWTLDPAARRLDRHCLAADEWLAHWPLDLMPTRRGMIFATRADATADDTGPAGLYAALPDRNTLLVPGIFGPLAVPPSGCKLAFAYARQFADMNFGTPGAYSIRAIDVCR